MRHLYPVSYIFCKVFFFLGFFFLLCSKTPSFFSAPKSFSPFLFFLLLVHPWGVFFFSKIRHLSIQRRRKKGGGGFAYLKERKGKKTFEKRYRTMNPIYDSLLSFRARRTPGALPSNLAPTVRVALGEKCPPSPTQPPPYKIYHG